MDRKVRISDIKCNIHNIKAVLHKGESLCPECCPEDFKVCPVCGGQWHEDKEECGNEV